MKKRGLESGSAYLDEKLKSKALRLLFEGEKSKSDIAFMIRAARRKAGLSQRELAECAGTTQAVVARLESGSDQRMPSLTLISKLLQAAGARLELGCKFGVKVGTSSNNLG